MNKYTVGLCSLVLLTIALDCLPSPKAEAQQKQTSASRAVRLAESFLAMHPDSIIYPTEQKSRKWNYEQGVVMEAFYKVGGFTGQSKYGDYVRKNLDYYVQAGGSIRTYQPDEYNLDNITPGKIALRLFAQTGDQRYKLAADRLREQLRTQPRTPEGGFWHKHIYPQQMWLDGLYMAEPFYALYSKSTNDSSAFDDIARQFILVTDRALDPKTGLYFHAVDFAKKQAWADTVTGCSPNLWGRSLGWLAMGFVDVLELFPKNHPQRAELVKRFQNLSAALLRVRDESSKIWYQVPNEPTKPGNYLEGSVSAMVVYAWAKGARDGYLEPAFLDRARESFEGIWKRLVVVDDAGIVHLKDVCSVAGLGGKPYRDGSFAYYISEPRRTDDFKGYGPLLLAAVELEQAAKESPVRK